MKQIIAITIVLISFLSFSALALAKKDDLISKNRKFSRVKTKDILTAPVPTWKPRTFIQADVGLGLSNTSLWDLSVHHEFFTPGLTLGFRFTYLTPGNINSLPFENYLLESRYYFDKANSGLYVFGGAGLGYISVPLSIRLHQDDNNLASIVNLRFLSTQLGIGYRVPHFIVPMVFEVRDQTFNWNKYNENYLVLTAGFTLF